MKVIDLTDTVRNTALGWDIDSTGWATRVRDAKIYECPKDYTEAYAECNLANMRIFWPNNKENDAANFGKRGDRCQIAFQQKPGKVSDNS